MIERDNKEIGLFALEQPDGTEGVVLRARADRVHRAFAAAIDLDVHLVAVEVGIQQGNVYVLALAGPFPI